jgi:two-component system OmpR family response regulator/two-component system response regulator QseB
MNLGYQVETAYDEEGAWAALQTSQFDLLIIDQFTPLVSGVELLKKIHATGMTLPIIMTTDFSTIVELARHRYLRSVKLIFKPCSFEKLLTMVRQSLAAVLGAGVKN